MDQFGASLEAAALGKPIPEDGYHGAYIADLAAADRRRAPGHPRAARGRAGGRLPRGRLRAAAQGAAGAARRLPHPLRRLVLRARRCTTSGAVEPRASSGSASSGHLFEADGALWMRTTDFGDDKDRVLDPANGELTYFASDTAYYVDKRERGFDPCIYLLGADHHGYVGRLKAMAACAGDDPEQNIEVLIGQLVKIMRGGEEVRLSKRAGTIVTLDELVDMIGVDALRYSLARYPADSPADPRRRRDHPRPRRQPGLLRAVRPRAPLPASCATPPTSASSRPGDELRPVAARRTSRRATCSRALAEFPRVVASRRRAARAAPGRPLPRGHRRRRSTGSTTSAACCRAATRSSRPAPGAAAARGSDPHRARQRTRPARRHRPRADVTGVPPRTRGWAARRRRARAGPPGCASPATPTRWSRCSGRRTARRRPTACLSSAASTCATWSPSTARRRTSSTRPTSAARARAFRDAFAGYDVFYAGKAFLCTHGRALDRRGGAVASTSARAASWPSRWRAGLRPGAHRLPRQQQVRRPS